MRQKGNLYSNLLSTVFCWTQTRKNRSFLFGKSSTILQYTIVQLLIVYQVQFGSKTILPCGVRPYTNKITQFTRAEIFAKWHNSSNDKKSGLFSPKQYEWKNMQYYGSRFKQLLWVLYPLLNLIEIVHNPASKYLFINA